MEKKLKMLIADNSKEYGERYAEIFSAHGIEPLLCEKNGKVLLDKIGGLRPDIVLAEAFLPELDIMGLLGELKTANFEKPLIIVMSPVSKREIEKRILEAGADYYFVMPFDVNCMAERIVELAECKQTNPPTVLENRVYTDTDLEIMMTDILREIGVNPRHKGYYYLREGIRRSTQNKDGINVNIKQIYSQIAEKYSTTESRVARNMHYAIEQARQNKNSELFELYFGNIKKGKKIPTNGEFIAIISDDLRLKLQIA